jgi:tetratricopeptide (TPR) repeat protein
MSRSALSLSLLCFLTLLPAALWAQPDGAGSHRRALDLYARGRYGEAAAAFKEAYLARPSPELLYAIGQALRQAGQCDDALEYYRQYLRTGPGPKQVVSTRENMKRCEEARPVRPSASRPASLPAAAVAPAAPAAPPRRAWYRDWLGGTLMGAGLAGLGAGAAVFSVGRSSVSEANRAADYASFERLHSGGQAGELQQKVGIAVLVTGAALLTAGVVRYLLVRRSAPLRGTAER